MQTTNFLFGRYRYRINEEGWDKDPIMGGTINHRRNDKPMWMQVLVFYNFLLFHENLLSYFIIEPLFAELIPKPTRHRQPNHNQGLITKATSNTVSPISLIKVQRSLTITCIYSIRNRWCYCRSFPTLLIELPKWFRHPYSISRTK